MSVANVISLINTYIISNTSGRITGNQLNVVLKAVLGEKIAVWFYQGALEWVHPSLPPPTIVEPKGAVPKKGPDKYRDIADAREGNKSLDDWGVHYFTWQDLADALTPLAIVCQERSDSNRADR